MNKKLYILIAILTLSCMACTKATFDNSLEKMIDYKEFMPIKEGKRWIYQLDSITPLPFGTGLKTSTYFLKDSVSIKKADSVDPTFYVKRYIATSLEQNDWQYQYTYSIKISSNKLIVTDENNRPFIKLANPISQNTNWNGNAYFLNSANNIKTDSDLYKYLNWIYAYQNILEKYETFDSTISIKPIDVYNVILDSSNVPSFEEKNLCEEVYAKGIGLVYRQFLYINYQGSTRGYQSNSFGFTIKLLNHN